jgi:hypothetical protein
VLESAQATEMRPVSPETVAPNSLQAATEPQAVEAQPVPTEAMPEAYVADEPPPYDEHDLPPWEMDADYGQHEAVAPGCN